MSHFWWIFVQKEEKYEDYMQMYDLLRMFVWQKQINELVALLVDFSIKPTHYTVA